MIFIKLEDLFKCETCFHSDYHTSVCKPTTVWCESGEAYRPAVSRLTKITEKEIVEGTLNKLLDRIESYRSESTGAAHYAYDRCIEEIKKFFDVEN